MPTLLAHANSDELPSWILSILRTTDLKVPEMDGPIVGAIKDDATMDIVRNSLATEFSGENADRVLVRTLRLVPHDVDWVYSAEMPADRSTRLMSAVMAAHDDLAIVEAQRDVQDRGKFFSILSRDPSIGAGELARILLLGAASDDDVVRYGRIALPHLPKSRLRSDLIASVVEKILTQFDQAALEVEKAVSTFFEDVGARQILWWSTSPSVRAHRVSRNLVVLKGLPAEQRKAIELSIDELSGQLIRRKLEDLDHQGFSAWAAILWEARRTASSAYLRASAISLASVLEMQRSPVSEIIAAAFPGVYAELLQENDYERDGLIGMFMALPRMMVGDWDHAKPARHGLVDAFMGSGWPPANLLLAAARAEILERVCLRLSRVKGGKKYLEKAIQDIGARRARPRFH